VKIAFVIEYFFPFDKGGSQWSTYYLAKQLVEKGHDITILTPNFGSKEFEIVHGIKILRYPFYKKTKNFEYVPGHFFFTNPLFMIWSAFFLFFYIKKEKPQIIHIQGKYSIPPVWFANLFLGLPIITTIRDYLVICNYGICLMKKSKSCSLIEYYTSDFKSYYEQYVLNRNVVSYLINILMSIWGRISTKLLKSFSKGLRVIVLSEIQKEIFLENGFKKVDVIYNSFEFSNKGASKKENIITYAGRLTPGKGVNLILDTIPYLLKLHPAFTLIFAGDGFLRKKLVTLSRKYKQIKILGNIAHGELIRLMAKSKIVLSPSIWPEPFGRIALEAIANNTPVVIGIRSGLLQEIVPRFGVACEPNSQSLLSSINKIISKNDQYRKQIGKDYSKIKKKFGIEVTEKYLQVYKETLG